MTDVPGAGLWSEPSPWESATPRDVARTRTFVSPFDLPQGVGEVHSSASALSAATVGLGMGVAGPPSPCERLPLSQSKDVRV